MSKKQHKRKRKRNWFLDTAIFLFLAGFFVLGGFSLWNYYLSSQIKYAIATNGSLIDTIPAAAVFVREETVYYAPVSGTLRPVVAEGERVTAGKVIAYIDSGDQSQPIIAEKTGIVQFFADGLESVLSPRNLGSIDWLAVFNSIEMQQLQGELQKSTVKKTVIRDEPVAKIVDNLADYRLMVYIEEEGDIMNNSAGISGGNMTISYNGDKKLTGKIEQHGSLAQGQYFLLLVAVKADDLLLGRYFQVTLSGEKVSGVIVPREAIVVDDQGITGLFYRQKNTIRFRPVEVLGLMGENAAISGVSAGTEVVTTPKYVKDGSRAN